jgi:hypothetical protein
MPSARNCWHPRFQVADELVAAASCSVVAAMLLLTACVTTQHAAAAIAVVIIAGTMQCMQGLLNMCHVKQ